MRKLRSPRSAEAVSKRRSQGYDFWKLKKQVNLQKSITKTKDTSFALLSSTQISAITNKLFQSS